jgi:hypothetical protein
MRISAVAKRTRKARDARNVQGHRAPSRETPGLLGGPRALRGACSRAAGATEGEMREKHVNGFATDQMGSS